MFSGGFIDKIHRSFLSKSVKFKSAFQQHRKNIKGFLPVKDILDSTASWHLLTQYECSTSRKQSETVSLHHTAQKQETFCFCEHKTVLLYTKTTFTTKFGVAWCKTVSQWISTVWLECDRVCKSCVCGCWHPDRVVKHKQNSLYFRKRCVFAFVPKLSSCLACCSLLNWSVVLPSRSIICRLAVESKMSLTGSIFLRCCWNALLRVCFFKNVVQMSKLCWSIRLRCP